MRYHNITKDDMLNGDGLRVVLWSAGCEHQCPGCQNPESHDPSGGFATTTGRIWDNLIKNPTLRGVTFSGGEPFLWAKELAQIGRQAHRIGLDVMTFSGWTLEQLRQKAETDENVRDLLSVSRYLVDGRYEQDKRDLSLRFRGSANQHIWDLGAGYGEKEAVLLDAAWQN